MDLPDHHGAAGAPRSFPRALFVMLLLYGGMTVLAGFLAFKQVALPIAELAVEAGIFAFLLLVVIASTVTQLYGERIANRLVWWGFLPLAVSIFLMTVLLWATEDYQEVWFNGFSISIYVTAVIAAICCMMPRIGLLTWKEAGIKWDLMIFAAGAYAAGNALESTKGAQWVINKMVYGLGIETMDKMLVYVVVIFMCMFSHMIFTSKTVRTTIMIPAIIALAKTLADAEGTVVAELLAVQGRPVDIGGYYHPDNAKLAAAMRPSPTLNATLATLAG